MQKIIYLLFTIFFFCSCKKTTIEVTLLEDGAYVGTFQRLYADGSGEKANVKLYLNQGNWSGESDRERYPALCHGFFSQGYIDKVLFENNCTWPTDFDQSLILKDHYQLKKMVDYIEIYRSVFLGDNVTLNYTDWYKLNKH